MDVDFADTRFSCAKDGSCPGGYTCVDGTCVGEDSALAADASAGGDAAAAPIRDSSPADDTDGSVGVAQCGVVEVEIALDENVTGTTVGGGAELDCGCNDCPGPEVVHRMLVEGDMVPVTLQATNNLPGTGYDTILYVRRACDDEVTEVACNDDGQGDTVTFEVTEPGFYYFIVDSHEGASGNYELEVTAL